MDNPGASANDIYTMMPFTTSVNKPSVSKIAGSDKMTTIGFKIELTIEKIKPARTNVAVVSTTGSLVPRSRTATQIPTELSTHLTKNIANCRLMTTFHYIITLTGAVDYLALSALDVHLELLATTRPLNADRGWRRTRRRDCSYSDYDVWRATFERLRQCRWV